MAGRGGEFVYAGYLIKSPPDNKPMAQWHRRWFLLMDSRLVYPLADRFVRLEYYQNEAEARRFADPKGIIRLNSCHLVQSREPVKGHKFVFDVCTADRTYHLAAESGDDKKNWLQTLNKLLFSNDLHSSEPNLSGRNGREEGLLRVNAREQRPLSHSGSSSSCVSNEQRPLPPIPSITQNRPLPRPPIDCKTKRVPPPVPAPYHTTHAGTPPPSTALDIAGHYEVAEPIAASVSPKPVRYKKQKKTRSLDMPDLPSEDGMYSVLEKSSTPGYDPDNADYSHLQTGKNALRVVETRRTEFPAKNRKSGYENVPHVNVPEDFADYSRLGH